MTFIPHLVCLFHGGFSPFWVRIFVFSYFWNRGNTAHKEP
jgi:hypothetical protein